MENYLDQEYDIEIPSWFEENYEYYSAIHNVLKTTPRKILTAQKYLLGKGEEDLARYLEGIKTDLLLYDYHTDTENYYNSLPVNQLNKFDEYLDKPKAVQKKIGEYAYKQIEIDMTQNRFAFQKYKSSVKKENLHDFTLEEKIEYYKGRIQDKSLSPGQRRYAYFFVRKNGFFND